LKVGRDVLKKESESFLFIASFRRRARMRNLDAICHKSWKKLIMIFRMLTARYRFY